MAKPPPTFDTWIQRDGTPIAVNDMETSHVQNTVNMLRTRWIPNRTNAMDKAQVEKDYDKHNIMVGYYMEWLARLETELVKRGVK